MITYNYLTSYILPNPALCKRWKKALVLKKGFVVGDIRYVFCDDKYLLNINQMFLQHDTFTDIVTFDNRVGETINGEIYISLERVEENAKVFNVVFFKELLRVMAHGLLHLCGYKDKEEREILCMRKEENIAIELYEKMELSL